MGKLNANLGPKIAAAVLPLGVAPASLGDFITALNNQDVAALGAIPGVTGEVIGAGLGALREAYNLGFRFIWVAAGCFTVAAAVGMFTFSLLHLAFTCEVGTTKTNYALQDRSSSSTPSESSTTASTTRPRRRARSSARPRPSSPRLPRPRRSPIHLVFISFFFLFCFIFPSSLTPFFFSITSLIFFQLLSIQRVALLERLLA